MDQNYNLNNLLRDPAVVSCLNIMLNNGKAWLVVDKTGKVFSFTTKPFIENGIANSVVSGDSLELASKNSDLRKKMHGVAGFISSQDGRSNTAMREFKKEVKADRIAPSVLATIEALVVLSHSYTSIERTKTDYILTDASNKSFSVPNIIDVLPEIMTKKVCNLTRGHVYNLQEFLKDNAKLLTQIGLSPMSVYNKYFNKSKKSDLSEFGD